MNRKFHWLAWLWLIAPLLLVQSLDARRILPDRDTGDALSVNNGLFVSKTAVADQPGTFAEIHSDAWGRTHKVVTPSKSGIGSAERTFEYSLPASSVKKVVMTDPAGRVFITESEAQGTITRSGIDLRY